MIPETISHYRILSQLGAGGMGDVYLAEDLNLGRRVALKLLPTKFTQDPDRVRRFEQEARAASTLSHPNILTIYEIGQVRTEAVAMHFMAMELVEGETLRKRLAGRRLRLDEAVDIATQISSALVASHNAGVTHRDIKPENIMLRNDGYLKVLDFGLAKLTEHTFFSAVDPAATPGEAVEEPFADLDGGSPLEIRPNTTPGVILGTLSYMSPEQARGLTVDARTDIFSLGIVLYEMIAGRRPFRAATAGDMMVAILDRDPLPITRYMPNAPEELEWILTKALAKDRHDRYQSMKSLLDDLKRLQRQLILTAGLTRTGDLENEEAETAEYRYDTSRDSARTTGLSGRLSSGSQRLPVDSLAVLPFFTTSSDPSAAYLTEGIPESLILNLSRLSGLRVMAWSTVAGFRGQERDGLAIGRHLGVRAIFAGWMYQFADTLVIKTELVDTQDGAQIWGAHYHRKLDDLFTIEQEISQEICERLRVKLNEEERARLVKRYTENAAAYQAYLKGRFYWNLRNAKALKKAVESFEEAIRLDDGYALAYAGLADCYCVVSIYGAAPPKAVMARAKVAALRALAIDDGLAEAHTSLAATLAWADWDWEASEREFKRAIELNPSYTVAHHWYGSVLLTAQKRFDEAMASELRALELEPLSPVVNSNLGFICSHMNRYEQAIDHLLKTLDIDGNFVYARFHLGLSYAHLGRYDEAVDELRRAMDVAGGRGALIQSALGYVYGAADRREEALQILAQLQTFPLKRDVSPFYLAMIHAGLREKEQTLQWLEKAVEERYHWVVWLRTEPMFTCVRGEEKLIELARRIGLERREEPYWGPQAGRL